MPVWLVVYGVVLVLLSLATHLLAPAGHTTILLTGGIGGALCVLLGILGMSGWRYRATTILTVAAVSYVLLSQTVISWFGGESRETAGAFESVLLTALLLISVGFVACFAQAGNGSAAAPAGSVHR